MKGLSIHQKITYASILIIAGILAIFMFRKVPTPPVSEIERDLRIQLDSAIKAHEWAESERRIVSARRAEEIQTLREDNQQIRWQLQNVRREYEKKINGLRNATPAELEKFFSDRYER